MNKILLATLCLVIGVECMAQFSIRKRKHLPGYSISFGFKHKWSSKRNSGKSINCLNNSQGDDKADDLPESSITMFSCIIGNLLEDSLVLETKEAKLFNSSESIDVPFSFSRKVALMKNSIKHTKNFFTPIGAGLLKLPVSKTSIVSSDSSKWFNYFGVGSVICSGISALGVLFMLVPALWFLESLLLLAIPGIVFGAVGLFGDKVRLSKIGLYLGVGVLLVWFAYVLAMVFSL